MRHAGSEPLRELAQETGLARWDTALASHLQGCAGPRPASTSRSIREATSEIRRRDFGLGFGTLGAMLGDVVKIELDLQFIELS